MIAIWGIRAFDAAVILANGKPPSLDFSMDPARSLFISAAITIGTGLLVRNRPLPLRLPKLDVNTSLKDGGRGIERRWTWENHLSGIRRRRGNGPRRRPLAGAAGPP